jgi:phosphoribosyl 1,2-cyclic phosphodiesterase
MKIKLWGVRGSIPTPLLPEKLDLQKKTLLQGFFDAGYTSASEIDTYLKRVPPGYISGYGGNTLCVQVISDDKLIFIDGGSGIREAGTSLMTGPCGKGQGEVHLFFTHFHWDHLMGVPFFTPIYIPGNVIHIYSVQPELETIFRTLFKKPFFPVPFEGLAATFVFHIIPPREPVTLDQTTITPYELDHSDICWGFRVEAAGKSYAHCVDTECKRFSKESLGPDLPLYLNADVMLFDAQYTLLESVTRIDWGHSTANLGLDLAMQHGIKKIIFSHHDPLADEKKIRTAENDTRNYLKLQLESLSQTGRSVTPVEWLFAREGSEIQI